MAYSKSNSAELLGISKKEFEDRAKKAGYDSTEAYWDSIGGDNAPLVEAMTKQVVEMNRQINELTPYLTLTQEEIDTYLEKAIAEITPYYDNKKAEIQASLEAGKTRTAEDLLISIRDIEEQTRTALEGFDLSTAETEEDFLNKIANITATEGEDIALKRNDYAQRLETMKFNQVQKGTVASGIGLKERQELEGRKSMEEAAIQRKADASEAFAQTAKNYNLENIALARRAAEEQRIRKVGTTSEAASTSAQAMDTAGITDMSQLGTPAELALNRANSGIVASTDATQLTDLEAEKTKAGIATQQEMQADQLAIRDATYGAQITKIQAEQAKKAKSVAALRGYQDASITR